MALLIDIGDLSDRHSDQALELICKAGHDHQDDDDLWLPHPSLYVRRLVELFTQRGLTRLDAVRAELARWVKGERARKPVPDPVGAPPPMRRWAPEELGIVKLYLESLAPEQFQLDDWMMLVDWIVQRYLPEDELRSEAEWLAVRANLMGRVQANMAQVTEGQADKILAALPTTEADAVKKFGASGAEKAMMDYARTHAAEAVVQLSDTVRHRMRYAIMDHLEAQRMKAPEAPGASLEQRLSDEFATLNRDWRRIAITEAGEAQCQGMVLAQVPGARLKRVEQYRGACAFCRRIDGKVMEVVSPDDPDKDGETEIWAGKTNIGRSAAPRMRVGGMLVERPEDQRWWVAAGVQHPNCRGAWVPVLQDEPGDDPEFGAWLRGLVGGKK